MSNYKQLFQKKCDLAKKSRGLLDLAKTEGRDMTSAETADFERIIGELRALEVELEVAEREREMERNQRTVSDWNEDPAETRQKEAGRSHQPSKLRPSQARPGEGRKFADLFGPVVRSENWADANEFFRAVHGGLADPRLIRAAAANEGIPAEGGFTVPVEVVAGLLDASLEDEIVRPRAEVVPMASSQKRVWGFRSDNSSSTLYGGFAAGGWYGEAAEINLEVPKLRDIGLIAKKLAILVEASNELLLDGSYQQGLDAVIVKAMSWYLDFGFLRGSGAREPLGVLNAPSLITVTKESGQAASTIVYENLTKMFSRLHPASVNKSVWVANPTTIPQLLQIKIVIKNVAGTENVGGAPVPVITESNGEFRILTRPVLWTEKLPSLGTAGDLLLADFSQYIVGLRKEMSLDRSAHLGFSRDSSHFRGILRGDGQPKWSNAYTPKSGSTLSWAVTLETRA